MEQEQEIFDARAVANEVIRLAHARPVPITNLEVLKLIYFAHGFMLALNNQRLFWQNVVAWPHGPVVIDVYESLKVYGRHPITEQIQMPGLTPVGGIAESTIGHSYRNMKKYSTRRLVGISHDPQGPWHKVWHGFGQNHVISNEMIKDYFDSLLK